MTSDERSQAGEGPAPAPSSSFSDLLRQLAAAPVVSVPGEGDFQARLAPGQQVGRFELLRELGRGGFGVVFEARDTELGRRVALKAVRTGRRSALRGARLQQEAEVAAHLSHPNIVTVFDYGRCDGGPYLVLELLRGESLHARMARGPVPLPEAVRIAAEVAEGLAHAHGLGVIHRDLTPGNVFLGADGAVKVLDFGLAHAFGRPRVEGGTPAYMSPEQWSGSPEDERTDVYALGVILYRLLAGKLPYPDDGGEAVRRAALAPALVIPGAPALAQLVARMLEPDPVLRPRNGREVLDALVAIQEQGPPKDGPVSEAPRRHRAAPRALALAALAAAAAAGAGWMLASRSDGAAGPLVVADVQNLSGDRALDGLSKLLETALERSSPSPRRLLSRSRALEVARASGHAQAARLDEALAAEVAKRVGASALLVPAVHRIGASFVVELRAVDLESDRPLFSGLLQVSSEEGVPSALEQLASDFREKLGAPASADGTPTRGRGDPGTLEAYRRYFAGQDHFYRWEIAEAEREYGRALQADPDFALAHLALYDSAKLTSRSAAAARHLKEALEHLERLPDKQRKIVLLAKAAAEGDAVLERAQEMVEADPADKDVLFAAAKALAAVPGRAGRGRSMELLRKILALDPARLDAAQALVVEHLLPAGLCEEAESVARGVEGLAALALACQGRTEEALAAARGAAASSSGAEDALVAALAAGFRLDEAQQRLEMLTGPGVDPTTRRYHLPKRARLLALRGRRREALKLLDEAEDMAGPAWELARKMVLDAGLARALRLDTGEAFSSGSPEDRALQRAGAARREGRLEDAARLYGELLAELALEARVANECWVAEMLLEAGRPAGALQILGGPERALMALSPGAVPRGIYLRALAQERLGRKDQALAEVERLSELWRGADPELPLLSEAAKLRRRLAAPERARSRASP